MKATAGFQQIKNWFSKHGWQSFQFQEEVWQSYLDGKSGIINAPAGTGKTFAAWFGPLMQWLNNKPTVDSNSSEGLQVLWITPLRTIASDIRDSLQESCIGVGVPWVVGQSTGDMSASEKQKQSKSMPEALVITPESLHILLSQKNYRNLFTNLKAVVVDEWHELVGTKRGVMIELGLANLRSLLPRLQVWGISATIGNLEEAAQILITEGEPVIIKSMLTKDIEMETILPDNISRFPWAGHLDTDLCQKLLPLIHDSKSTLIFTNTRSQAESCYKALLDHDDSLLGAIALHNGSSDAKIRKWVDESKLKVVICTSSLGLGIDFRPVDTVIQIGSPKSVMRFLQRAGRSGHSPSAKSKIYFVPTHSLELLEAAALRTAIAQNLTESKPIIYDPIDVLIQYLITLAIGAGFKSEHLFKQIRSTNAYRHLSKPEWEWVLEFITSGKSLQGYRRDNKVQVVNGIYQVTDRKIALQHRLSIGTVVSDINMPVQMVRGGKLGTVEESFVMQMQSGESFWLGGRCLKLVKVKDNIVWVQRSQSKQAVFPHWLGGRSQLSPQLSEMMRSKLDYIIDNSYVDVELEKLLPLFQIQQRWSKLPKANQLLIEQLTTRAGHHIFVYPFAGRSVHEGLAALMAYRISQQIPTTFSLAMNDYGFELLIDQEIPLRKLIHNGLFARANLEHDVQISINSTEMAKRQFREIARIAGLTVYSGESRSSRSKQVSAELLFDSLREHEPDNLLLRQAFQQVLSQQLQFGRIEQELAKINEHNIVITNPPHPTPFAFPLIVDSWRDKLSSESLEDRITKMQLQLEKFASE